jgi:hypothetical protein
VLVSYDRQKSFHAEEWSGMTLSASGMHPARVVVYSALVATAAYRFFSYCRSVMQEDPLRGFELLDAKEAQVAALEDTVERQKHELTDLERSLAQALKEKDLLEIQQKTWRDRTHTSTVRTLLSSKEDSDSLGRKKEEHDAHRSQVVQTADDAGFDVVFHSLLLKTQAEEEALVKARKVAAQKAAAEKAAADEKVVILANIRQYIPLCSN